MQARKIPQNGSIEISPIPFFFPFYKNTAHFLINYLSSIAPSVSGFISSTDLESLTLILLQVL